MATQTKTLIAVCGPGASATPELEILAEEVGRELARVGLGVVCGGRGGVMEAVCRGAKAEGGLTVGILPSHNRAEANPYVDIVICTGLGEARNMLVSSSGAALIAVGGEWGTLSEIALALKIGRPVITLAGYGWDIRRVSDHDPTTGQILAAATPQEAVRRVLEIVQGVVANR
jgi:uncharacterized protein (TIGR00725 family)